MIALVTHLQPRLSPVSCMAAFLALAVAFWLGACAYQAAPCPSLVIPCLTYYPASADTCKSIILITLTNNPNNKVRLFPLHAKTPAKHASDSVFPFKRCPPCSYSIVCLLFQFFHLQFPLFFYPMIHYCCSALQSAHSRPAVPPSRRATSPCRVTAARRPRIKRFLALCLGPRDPHHPHPRAFSLCACSAAAVPQYPSMPSSLCSHPSIYPLSLPPPPRSGFDNAPCALCR
jgi:hypothetical protein